MRAMARVLALTLALPAWADADATPTRKRPDLRYVISGAVLLGAFYVPALALAIRYEEGELALPVLGPIIDLRRCRDCTGDAVGRGEVAGLVLDAALQAAGASLLVVGLIRRKPARVSLVPAPWGVTVAGRF